MKQFHTKLLLISMVLIIKTIPSFGQDDDKKTLILQLPETHRWTSESFEEGDIWGIHYRGFIGDERYSSIDIQQTNMFNRDVDISPQQIAKQSAALIKSYDDTAELLLRKQQKINGDEYVFYAITTEKSVILLFILQSKLITHSVELELYEDQLERNTIDTWEKLFFKSFTSD